MSLRNSVATLKAKVRRLEDEAGKGRRNCPQCRLTARRWRPDPAGRKLRPEEVVEGRCDYCGSALWLNLNKYPEGYREIVRLHFPLPAEAIFTDPNAYALYLWADPRRELLKGSKGGASSSKSVSPGGESAMLAAQCEELERRLYRGLVAKYGDDPFPEMTRLVESILVKEHTEHDPSLLPAGHWAKAEFDELERDERHFLVCAEMEWFIFGRVLPETKTAVGAFGDRIDKLLGRARQQRQWRAEAEERRLAEEARLRVETEERLRRADEERRRKEEEEARVEEILRAFGAQ